VLYQELCTCKTILVVIKVVRLYRTFFLKFKESPVRLSRISLIFISGIIWLCVSAMLLKVGSKLLFSSIEASSYTVLMPFMLSLIDGYSSIFILFSIGTVIGFLKGNFILAKVVKREVLRLQSIPEPCPVHQIYSIKQVILIAMMMGLGMLLRFLGAPVDIHGVVDIAVGAALFQGATHYFRYAFSLKKAIA
jgi:hypothetical protein